MKSIRLFIIMMMSALLITGCAENSTIPNEPITKDSSNAVEQQESTKDIKPKVKKEISKSTEKLETVGKNRISATLLYVIDGDTIKIKINGKEESVRFLLVDTPETKHPRLGVQPFGHESKNFTKKLLSGSDTVLLEKDIGERDKYGRLLMYVYTQDGISVQEELLKNGLARVAYVYAPNTKYVDKYYAIQKKAQNEGVGIWSVEDYAREDGFHKEVVDKESDQSTSLSPNQNGECNGQIKGNQGSNGKIYHLPSGRYYQVTKAEECFRTEQDAARAGYRKSSY